MHEVMHESLRFSEFSSHYYETDFTGDRAISRRKTSCQGKMHVWTVGWRPDWGKLFSFLIRVETTGNCRGLRGELPRSVPECAWPLPHSAPSPAGSWELPRDSRHSWPSREARMGRGQEGATVSRRLQLGDPHWTQSISHKHCHGQPGISMARNSSRQLCQLPQGHLCLTPASTRKVPVWMKSWFISPKSADCFGSVSGSDQAWARPLFVCSSLLAGQSGLSKLRLYWINTSILHHSQVPRHDVCC